MAADGRDLEARWLRALGVEYLKPHAANVQEGAIRLPYDLLHRADMDLAAALVDDATRVLQAGEAVAQARIRVVGLEEHRVAVRDLRPKHLGRLVSIEGLVKRATPVRPGVVEAVWRCRRCDALVPGAFTVFSDLEPPFECNEDDGGCGRNKSGAFDLDEDRSVKVSSQRLEVQDSPEALLGGEQPGRLSLHVTEDLCNNAQPGDRVVANGILRDTRKRKSGGRLDAVSEFYLHVVSIERRSQAYEAVSLTPEDEEVIRRLASDPGIFAKITASIAPSLYGLEDEKLAVALQLFGGVERHGSDKVRSRGDIHILLLGDPGVAKSQLLRSVARLSPRGIYTSGRGASAAGLTAAATQDGETGRWILEAGALVLADRGLCCIDEIDKMSDADRQSIHVALEQGIVPIAKASINTELNSRTSVLAAGNPKEGRFDPSYKALSAQVELDPALLSRFDLVFVLADKPDEARDAAIISHALQPDREAPPIPPELLRKYVAYAKKSCEPRLTPEAAARIRDCYVSLRQGSKPDSPVQATPRQGEALRRLAEASARARLSNDATVDDVERAIRLVQEQLRRVGGDIDKLTGPKSFGQRLSQQARVRGVLAVIAGLEGTTEDGAYIVDVLRRCRTDEGIEEGDAREVLERLSRDGRIVRTGSREQHLRRVPE